MDRYPFLEGVFVYFVTFSIKDWLPIFISPEPINIIIDSLNFCVKEKNLRINGYVLMPNHLHLIVFDAQFDNKRLHQTLTNFRKFTGNKLAEYIDQHLVGTVASIIHLKRREDRDRQIWQQGWHAEGLMSEHFWAQKLTYIHENPVRKGLVRTAEHWRYSSAGFWSDGQEGDVPVAPIEPE